MSTKVVPVFVTFSYNINSIGDDTGIEHRHNLPREGNEIHKTEIGNKLI